MKSYISAIAVGLMLVILNPAANAKSFGANLCANDSRFYCYKVKSGDTWQRFGAQRDLVMRINRINIRLHPGMIIAVPNNPDHTDMLEYAPLSRQIKPTGEKIILVSIHEKQLAFGAYDADGTLQYWGPVSGGKGYCADIGRGCHTALGQYTIYRKEGAGCKSTKFPVGRGGAPMPYCMYFHGGFAMHGSYDVPGYNASHGCLRMFVNDAQWLNQEFTPGSSVTVVVKSSQI